MTRQCKGEIRRTHPAAIVPHTDHRFTSIRDINGDALRPCINGILNQFLYRRCGSFHHFSSRNSVSRRVIQLANNGAIMAYVGVV